MKQLLLQTAAILGLFWLKIEKKEFLMEMESNRIIDIIIGYLSFLLIIGFIKTSLFYVHRRRKKIATTTRDNITSGIQNIYWLITTIVTLFTILSLMGVDVFGVLQSLSIIAAAIAILSKDYISNIISGMLIAFSNDISLGDYIKVGQNKGRVIDMSLTMFSLLTDDDDVAIIPNNMVYTLDVINFTKKELKKTSIDFEVMLVAIEGVKQLEEDLIEVLLEYKDDIKENSYNLRVDAIKKDLLECKFQYILNAPNRDLEKKIRKKVIRRVVQIIKM